MTSWAIRWWKKCFATSVACARCTLASSVHASTGLVVPALSTLPWLIPSSAKKPKPKRGAQPELGNGEDPASANTVAYTHGGACKLFVNGVDLLSTCAADKTAAYMGGGVCAAAIDTASEPRTACFDTKVEGQGAEQLASWIDTLPQGASVMIASCARRALSISRPLYLSISLSH